MDRLGLVDCENSFGQISLLVRPHFVNVVLAGFDQRPDVRSGILDIVVNECQISIPDYVQCIDSITLVVQRIDECRDIDGHVDDRTKRVRGSFGVEFDEVLEVPDVIVLVRVLDTEIQSRRLTDLAPRGRLVLDRAPAERVESLDVPY